MDLQTYAQVAAAQDLPVTRVAQQVRDGHLVAVDTPEGARIPAEFVQDGAPVKHLPGVVTLLRDGGYRDDEIVAWLFREDDTLPGTPIDALRSNRGTEIKRRAQSAAF
ncbi:Rv2175c family DNA-binding protein [Jatrophihabitans sp. YIM 134969]